jgi:polysaccharide biosynthesis/export protein
MSKTRSERTHLIVGARRTGEGSHPILSGPRLGLLIIVLLAVLGPGVLSAAPQNAQLPVMDYKIGTKDLLEIKVFELPELNQTVRVAEDGSISLALLGRIEASGLTAQELEKKLAAVLNQQYTKVAHVTVFIREFQKVSVLGAVGKPGMFEIVGPMTLLQVIAQAGGLTAQAMSEVYVYRREPGGQKNTITISLDDLIRNGNTSANIELQPNDVVNIPIEQMLTVYVYGEVKTPGAIQYKQSKQITLLQAIAQAGGTTEWASTSRVIIKKKEKQTGKEMQRTVNLKTIISGQSYDVALEEGDIVIVP